MASEPTFYLLPPFNTIPAKDPHEWIGRIVKFYNDPRANFTPPRGNPAMEGVDIDDDPGFRKVEEIIDSASSESARLLLADMLHFTHSRSRADTPRFQSDKVRRLKLSQEDTYCKRALALDDVKAQLKEWHKINRPVYLIVGLLIADCVHYAEETMEGSSNEIGAKPPTRLTSLAVGSPVSMPDIVEGSVSKTMQQQRGMKLTATGKRIFAVEYRVLTKRLLSMSGQVDMRPGGIRGDRTFGQEEDAMGGPTTEEQQTEVIADPDPLPDVVEDADAEEYCFNVII